MGKRMNESLRFWSKVRIESADGCWLWIARSVTSSGYATFGTSGGPMPAHRWAYQQMRGPIPEGLHIDHLCRTPLCMNPWHLEPVTPAENNRRMHAAQTTCLNGGHRWTAANTYIFRGYRLCRGCRREADRKRQAKRTAEVTARKAARTLCVHGHAWISANIYLDRGHPVCRVCKRDAMRRQRALNRRRVEDP